MQNQNINIELFSRLFLLNLSNNFRQNCKTNEVCSVVSEMASTSSSHSGSGLEPPTPPRTPVIPGQKVSDKNFNNNNDFTNRIFGEHSKDLNEKSTSESDYEISFRTSNNFRDDCNNSDEEGHQSVVSDMQEANDDGENSSGDLGSLDKFSLKNFDSFFDKSSLVSFAAKKKSDAELLKNQIYYFF